ncbi:MAG: nicotinamide riboside transporter PnuC [Mediterranea sp.]|jgi:nicotinamide mononucleotide transporter|nr:nicotinamide riboside transporter PnuC [Mediterranea sp.]
MELFLEILAAVTGIIYLWLEYRASIYLWIVGIIMPAIYIAVYYDAGIYANLGINVYYLVVALYGWWVWRYGGRKQNRTEMPVTRMPVRYYLWAAVVCTVLFFGLAWLLIYHTDSDVPWLDAFTTALSVVGMWMLARKYVEQWWVWIVVDTVSVGMYIDKALYYLAMLYITYVVVAVFGYMKWKKLMQ